MRKIISLLVLLTLNFCLFAQNSYDINDNVNKLASSIDISKFQFGLKLSPSISWINVNHNDLQAEGATVKFGIGGVVEYPIASFLSFVSGVNYRSVGGYALDNNSLNDATLKNYFKMNYSEIEIPIGLKIQTKYIYKVSYFLQGGVSAGFITSANEKYYPVAANSDPIYINTDIYTNPTRISYQLGAGISYSLGGKSNVFGLISYNNAITNIANSQNYTSGTSPRYTSPVQILPGSMEFSIGVMF